MERNSANGVSPLALMPLEHGLVLFSLSDERNVSQGEPGSQILWDREINGALPNVIIRFSVMTDVVIDIAQVNSEHLEITTSFPCSRFNILSWQQVFRVRSLVFLLPKLLIQLALGDILIFLYPQRFNFPHLFNLISLFLSSFFYFILSTPSSVFIFHAISLLLSVNSFHEMGLLNIALIS